MLDDLKRINERDKDDMLGSAARSWRQLEQEFDTSEVKIRPSELQNVAVAGMGGSALTAEFVKSWLDLPLPLEICRGYDAPAFVSDKTLFIASSYSGNTEETLSALKQAETKGARIAVMTHGGELERIAAANDYPLLKIPSGYQPRHALFYGMKALAGLFDAITLTKNATGELAGQTDWLKTKLEGWSEVIPTAKNPAKQLALEMMGKSVVIYAGPRLAPAAHKWKIDFNENAKQVAWWNQLPEFNHNEFTGWSGQPVAKPYAVIELHSELEHARIQKRFDISEKLLSGMRPAPQIINVEGKSELEQLLWAACLGEFVSIYTALLSNLNPGQLKLVDKFKKQLED